MLASTRLSSPALTWLAVILFCAGTLQWITLPEGAAAARTWSLSACSLAALITALLLAWDWRSLRAALAIFAIMLAAGWIKAIDAHTAHTHFTGASLGVLWMVLVARNAVTPERLKLALLLFLGLALPALAVGMAGIPTFFPPETFGGIADPSRLRVALVSAAGNAVNQNALAALVLIAAPVALSTLWLREPPRGLRIVLQMFGVIVFGGGMWILSVTRSDTALIALWGMMLVVLVRGSRWGWRALAALFIGALPLAALVWLSRVPRERAMDAAGYLHYVLLDRIEILQFAAGVWSQNLLLGIGLNDFRRVYAASHPAGAHAAHAHNFFLQTGLDIGLIGLLAYCFILGLLLFRADRAARGPVAIARSAAAGAAFSLIGVHLFGLADAVALGAKIGMLQWMAGGIILGAWQLQRAADVQYSPRPAPEPSV